MALPGLANAGRQHHQELKEHPHSHGSQHAMGRLWHGSWCLIWAPESMREWGGWRLYISHSADPLGGVF